MMILGGGGLSAVQLTLGSDAIRAVGGNGGSYCLKNHGCTERPSSQTEDRGGSYLEEERYAMIQVQTTRFIRTCLHLYVHTYTHTCVDK